MMRWFFLNIFPGYAYQRQSPQHTLRPLILPMWIIAIYLLWSRR
jgi:hypothetical protein